MMQKQFRITGWHVLSMLVAFFLVIIIANTIFITLAVRSFPGEKEEKSYLQGLHYNDRIAARDAQSALGWTASIEQARLLDGEAHMEISFAVGDRPLNGLDVAATLSRPASAEGQQEVAFSALGAGRYRAIVEAGPGVWNFEGRALNRQGEEFEFSSRLVLE